MDKDEQKQTKISIRFFDDREVRAVWSKEKSEWYFSALDIIGVLNSQSDYGKNRNYWKYLKAKLKNEKNELVSRTTQLPLIANDEKIYKSDCISASDVVELAKNFPSNKANRFIEWFTYSNTSIAEKYIEMKIKSLLRGALIAKINDREIFMKGIDYSYYYEES